MILTSFMLFGTNVIYSSDKVIILKSTSYNTRKENDEVESLFRYDLRVHQTLKVTDWNPAKVNRNQSLYKGKHLTSEELQLHTVAIGCAITSVRSTFKQKTLDLMISKVVMFRRLLPTFCITASVEYFYHFYIAYDYNDEFFKHEINRNLFMEGFILIVNRKCVPRAINVGIHLVECNHHGKPAWAQNDAMMEAYLDNMEFYYRINDDTSMHSEQWTEQYIRFLQLYDPPYVGVVGPNHKGGKQTILTYDFVHRTHIDIFGYYYPQLFTGERFFLLLCINETL
jgi:hypothetical protein